MPRKKIAPPVSAASASSYKHDETRKRIPTQEESALLPARDRRPVKKVYQYDPSIDPQLVWSGKEERGAEFGVSTVPIYVQEKIAPEAIIAKLKDENAGSLQQQSLFGDTAADQYNKMVGFYEHEDKWQNRMILGDSLIVMNSLLEKEGMRGRVQCVYIDPPYGIKFGSNWQVSTRKRDVKDNKLDDFVRQPEQIKAFRDTWELGIHSYLTYLRDRLITSRELLTDSGSCFVQISDENLHIVRNLMDEVFGSENFVSVITFAKTTGFSGKALSSVSDYIIWYAKRVDQLKYRQLYFTKAAGEEGAVAYKKLSQLPVSKEVIELYGADRLVASADLTSQGASANSEQNFKFEGRVFLPSQGSHWKTTVPGLERLAQLGRIFKVGNTLRYLRFIDDFPVYPINNTWTDTGVAGFTGEKIYVVQTTRKVIERCILMATDPGDIVLDPTCGSGTAAHAAEQWGRRWITIDTSRVALALARTRLMTSKYQYYKLKEANNVRSGFEYKAVPHITLKSIANNEPADQEMLFDQPLEDKDRVRVSGPFTVESLSPHRVSDEQEMLSTENYVNTIIENLRRSGIQTGDKGARVEFENLDILPGGPEIQARGEYRVEGGLKSAAICIGPEFGSVDDDMIRDATAKAGQFADLLIVAGSSFDASASTEPSEVNGMRVMKVKINPDLSMGDLLKKTQAANLFMAFGEPDIRVKSTKEGVVIEIKGVDVYDPVKGEIRSSGSGSPEHDIACWFIDTNYDGKSFFVSHAYFLGDNEPFEKLKRALKAEISEEAWDSMNSTVSRPFPVPTSGKIAVKAINHYGDEVMKVIEG